MWTIMEGTLALSQGEKMYKWRWKLKFQTISDIKSWLQALRKKYKEDAVKKLNRKRLNRLKFFSFYIIPTILTIFTLGYFIIGFMHTT